MSAPPDDRGQLDFLQHVQRIFDEGEFVAKYKFALLIALVELAIERGDDTGAPLELDLHSIAEKFIEQYWPHAAPYGAAEGAPAVLVQNHGRQAAIVARIAELRGRFGSLTRAKSDRSWPGFVGSIAQIVKEMPLWKLQTLRRRNVPFLYEKSSGPRITLLPGVAFNPRRCRWRAGPTAGRGHVGAALGEFEVHGECGRAVSGDTGRVKLTHSSLV